MWGSPSALAVASRPHRFARRKSSSSDSLSRSDFLLTFNERALAQDLALEPDPRLLAVPGLRRDARVAQLVLLQLVRLRSRQLVHVLDEARDPVAGHAVREVLDQVGGIELGAGLEHDADLCLLVAGLGLEIGVVYGDRGDGL